MTKAQIVLQFLLAGRSHEQAAAESHSTPTFVAIVASKHSAAGRLTFNSLPRLRKTPCAKITGQNWADARRGWTDARVAELTDLYVNQGQRPTQLAKHFGVSRNSIIGKIHRLGLPRPGKAVSKMSKAQRKAKMALQPRVFQMARLPKSAAILQFPGAPLPAPEETDIPRKTILQLEERDCKWPCAPEGAPQQMFCAAPKVAGLPYCEVHVRRAFQAPPPRRQAPVAEPIPTFAASESELV